MPSYEEIRKQFLNQNPKAKMNEKYTASGLSNFDEQYRKRARIHRGMSREQYRKYLTEQQKKTKDKQAALSPLKRATQALIDKYHRRA